MTIRVATPADADGASAVVQRIVEYWPDPFPAAAGRAHLVERIG